MNTETQQHQIFPELLTMKDVKRITGLSRTTIYQLIRDGEFPRQVKFGASSKWLANELHQWLADRINERDAA